ncbi:hypothetical protein EBR96_05160 [bacterium]|nr:hypothetical protein [bacterium]
MRSIRYLLTAAFTLLVGISPALGGSAPLPPSYDAVVMINESTLNKFLEAIGPISGGGVFNNGRSSYTWTVKNPAIKISKDAAAFTADAQIESGIFSYGTTAKGDVDVTYDNNKNVISVKIRKASFEVAIDLFGNKIKITDVDISAFYRPKFEFPGPQPLQNAFNVDMPDKKSRPIQIGTHVKKIALEPGRIVVASNFVFTAGTPSGNATKQ